MLLFVTDLLTVKVFKICEPQIKLRSYRLVALRATFLLNLRHCEKATQFEKTSPLFRRSLSEQQNKWDVFLSISCGLFRKPELEMGEN